MKLLTFAILAVLALAMALTYRPSGNCARIPTTVDGYVCSRAAFEHWKAYQSR